MSANQHPRVGNRVRATGVWNGKRLDITGTVLASPRNPNQPHYPTERGHWRARIQADSGVAIEIPWSTKIMTFKVLCPAPPPAPPPESDPGVTIKEKVI